MKKIINGKMYNTETAKELGYKDNGYNGNDFNWCCETLYQKRTGEYFLLGEGGPMSPYAACHGNETSGSSEIIPISEKEAKEWAEQNLTAEEYIKAFGEPEE